MKDRIPGEGKEGLVRLTPVDEKAHLYKMERADDPVEPGSPLSKATLLTDEACRLYGFDNSAVPDAIFKAIAPAVTSTIVVTAPVGSTVRVSNGELTIEEQGTDGMWTFYVQRGEWTVTAERGYDSQSALISVSEVREYSVRLLMAKVYGVRWDGGESSAWSRTDDSAKYPDPTPAKNNGTGNSPFDEFMPWSGMMRLTDENGNEVVSIPKFWYKWTFDEGKMHLQIADYPADGFHVSPGHAPRFDGDAERDVIYVSRYHCGAGGKSVSNVAPETRVTITAADNALKGDYVLFDYSAYWTICMLYLVEYADWHCQAEIGAGCGVFGESSGYLTGQTDEMAYHTGTEAETRGSYGATQYRYIEDLWGNVADRMAAVGGLNGKMYFDLRPTSTPGSIVAIPCSVSSGYIAGWSLPPSDEGYEFAIVPNKVVDSEAYVRDWFQGTSAVPANNWGYLVFGGWGGAKNAKAGLFQLKLVEMGAYNNVGYRFVRLPGYSG